MNSPAAAMAWEIWARHRRGLTLVPSVLALTSAANLLFFRNSPNAGLAEAWGYAVLTAALFLTFGFFHFTEGQRKGGFGSFPLRLFKMPVRSEWLVALPMGCGMLAVISVYVGGAWLIFRPLDITVPKLWPCLYLSSGLALYQMIIWSFPERRYLKLFLLSCAAMLIAFGWMFFLPDLVEGTLSEWGFQGESETFQAGLFAVLAAMGPAAYAFSVYCLNRQRHGTAGQVFDWPGALEGWNFLSSRGRRSFAKPEGALFWLEWRQSGMVLPIAVGIVLAATCIPSFLSGPLSGKATTGLLAWLFIAPLALAAIIGRGFAKPDFWNPLLGIPHWMASRPVSAGAFVVSKLKAAGCSVALTWVLVLYVTGLWLGHAGDLGELNQLRAGLEMYYPGSSRWLLPGLAFFGWVLLSWRFMVSGLPAGLSGSKRWYYASNMLMAGLLVALLAGFIWQGDYRAHGLHLYDLWNLIVLLPALFGGVVIAKVALAGWAWNKAYQSLMVSARTSAVYFGIWFCGTGLLVLGGYMAFANTPWLRNLVCLAAFLVVPLASPALGMLAWSANRTGSPKAACIRISAGLGIFLWLFTIAGSMLVILLAAQGVREMPRRISAGENALRMSIASQGSPTVLFECFGRANLEIWNRVQPEVARFARTAPLTQINAGCAVSMPV